MAKTIFCAAFVFGQAAALLAVGAACFLWSSDLMQWLIRLVGYERALGSGNVIRHEDGSILLTNPTAMVYWTLPFWCLGVLEVSAGITLACLGWQRLARRDSPAGPRVSTEPEASS